MLCMYQYIVGLFRSAIGIPIDVWSFIFGDGSMFKALPSFIFVITIPYFQFIPEFMIILSSCFHTQFWGFIIFGQVDHWGPLFLKIINLIKIHERLGKNYTSKLFKKNKQTKKLYALRSQSCKWKKITRFEDFIIILWTK